MRHTINMALLLPSVCFHSIYCAYFHHAYIYFTYMSVCLLHIRLWLKHSYIFLPKYGETRYKSGLYPTCIYICLSAAHPSMTASFWFKYFSTLSFLFQSKDGETRHCWWFGFHVYVTASYWYFPCYFHSSFEHPKTGEMRYCLDLLSYSKETEIFQTLFTWTMHCIHLSVRSTSIYDCFTFGLILIYSIFKH